jgi:methionyl aminopeptidase
MKSEKDLDGLRASGRILATILQRLKEAAHEGVRLRDIDALAARLLQEAHARSAFLGYKPEGSRKSYPAHICTSVNEQIVHGLPTDYVLKSGDLLKIDLGVKYQDYFTDAAVTVGIGNISPVAKNLIAATEAALSKAIAMCQAGNHLGDIGFVIEKTTQEYGFRIIKGLTGHGTGFALHEDPTIYNFGKKGEGIELQPGMVLAIEPMVAAGSARIKQHSDDSFATVDKSLTAHFEHTIAIKSNDSETLTRFEQ